MSTESTLKIIFAGAYHKKTSPYGWRTHPVKGVRKFHYGVDYGCSKVPVYAIEDGTVYARGYDSSAGNYVYVKYARLGVAVAYFHLSKISVKKGAKVSKGTKVGVAGTTGSSTGVHLHIGVRNLSSWKWQNPETWLANYKAKSSSKSTSSTSSTVTYKVGSTYTLKANLKVRKGAGTKFAQKKRSELTDSAKKHALSGTYAELKKGTKVTCQKVSGNWIKIPSGWVCGKSGSKVYIK